MGVRKTLMIIGAIKKEPFDRSSQRGFAAEEKAFKAAKYWQKKKLIKEVRWTEGLSPEDRAGKDLIVLLWNGKEVGIDVKTFINPTVLKEAKEKGVELFCVDPEEEIEAVRNRMLGLIILSYFSGLECSKIREIVKSLPSKKISRFWKIKKLTRAIRKAF